MAVRQFWVSASDFRLGGGQHDRCPHRHRSAATAAACDWFSRDGIQSHHPMLRVVGTDDAGRHVDYLVNGGGYAR